MPWNSDAEQRLGQVLRAARKTRGMTLVEVAAAAQLSQPFLSQLELGRARPSMRSLHRIAVALGTTQQALLAAAAPPDAGAAPVRGTGADLVDNRDGGARLLLHDPSGVDVTEFVGLPREFEEFFVHSRAELLYLARGTVEVEIREEDRRVLATLHPRDTLTCPGGAGHRYRQIGDETCVLLVIHHDA
ncbi:helix-turn-helix domain-containing protein [Pseudonocardia sp. CA-107938]|uniref:helix-turn-helix domain-containing protein n=1 Tax=Pseudonocardia sp. CA-107938 TaxID=3240021 RepID=UPI003D8EE89D